MKEVLLRRHTYHPHATMGRLYIGELELHTIERPWLYNKPYKSCIPHGVYTCQPYTSEKYPDVYEVCDVPDRTHILFHAANRATDVQGCIGLGLGVSTKELMVLNSKAAMEHFMDEMDDEDFRLIIKQAEYPNL